ncbi:DUF3347 domain-containing protein [bacterium]|nr:DUF3347 domain-containing protein [bacterium]
MASPFLWRKMMFKFISAILMLMCFAFTTEISAESNLGSSIFNDYLKIGAALSQDQHSEAAKHAKNMKNTVSDSNNQKVKDELLPAIDNLSSSKDLETARKSYEQLSSKLNTVKKDLGIQADEYYCPMVKKTWLQKESKIVNPYVGKDMASCGEKKS